MDSIMDISAVESKLNDVSITAIPMNRPNSNGSLNLSSSNNNNSHSPSPSSITLSQYAAQMPQIQISAVQNSASIIPQQQLSPPIQNLPKNSSTNDILSQIVTSSTIPANLPNLQGLSKYAQLLAIIEEMGRDIRPTYTGSRTSSERLKRGIVHARILVRECLMETERRN